MANILLEQAFKALEDIQDVEISAKDLYDEAIKRYCDGFGNCVDIYLPNKLSINLDFLVDDLEDVDDSWYLEEAINEYLSDEYSSSLYGFDYTVDKDAGLVHVTNIKWNTTESLDKYITEEDDNTDLDTYEDRLHHLKDLYDMEPGDLTADEIKELHDAGMLEENVEVCEKCGKNSCECLTEEKEHNVYINVTLEDDSKAKYIVDKNILSNMLQDDGIDAYYDAVAKYIKKHYNKEVKNIGKEEPVTEENHVCEKCGKEVCECDKKLQEGPNTTTTISVLDDGEKVIKQSGYSALCKKLINGKPVYTVKYAPGYVVNTIEAKHDKEAINKFLGLNEGVNKELEYDYYVVSYGNPYKAVVLNNKNDAIQTAKNFNSDEKKEGEWVVYHYTKPYDGELKYDIIKEELEEVAREEYCVLVNGNNEECYNSEEDAIKFARQRFAEEGNDSEVKVLLVKYGPKDEHGDEAELGFETIWANHFEESCKESKEECKDCDLAIKNWVDEEARDQGLSDIYFGEIKDLEDAKHIADKLFDEYASVEVVKNVDTEDEEVLYGRYPEDESLKEDLSKDEKSVSEEHKEDDKVVCAKCGSEEVKFNDPETKEPLCADCFEERSAEFEEEVLGKEKLEEGITVNINDEDEVKKAKKEVEASEKRDDTVEKIVDVDAESIEELKDSYVGNVILVCNDCMTPRFIKPELLKKDEATGLFNVGEACPHCGSENGYKAEGQVAKADVEVDETSKDTTGANEPEVKDEETKVDVEVKDEEKPLPSAMESLEKTEQSRLEKVDLNEQRFDRLVNKFIHATYENVENYKTNTLYLSDDNSLIVEGIITYKSGKEKQAQFKLVEKKLSTVKEDVVALTGICEAFNTCEKAFTFRGNLKENKLDLNSLTYNFNTKVLNESKNIKGKVCIKY